MTTKVNGNRKLPPYNKLCDLLITKGMSYKDIGMKYGVHFSAVSSTLKRDRIKLGLPWPMMTERGARISKSLDDIMVDATVIRDLLRETYEERQSTFVGDTVLVSSRSVLEKDHRDRRRYHVEGCFLAQKMGNMIQTPIETAHREGYKPCGTCCKISVAVWAKELNVNVSAAHMYRLISFTDDPNVRRIRKSTAVKLLKAIGEEPHEVLSGWKPKKAAFATPKGRRVSRAAA